MTISNETAVAEEQLTADEVRENNEFRAKQDAKALECAAMIRKRLEQQYGFLEYQYTVETRPGRINEVRVTAGCPEEQIPGVEIIGTIARVYDVNLYAGVDGQGCAYLNMFF